MEQSRPAANRRANRKYFLLTFIILIEIIGPNERSHTRSRRSESVCGWHCRHERRRASVRARPDARAGIAVVLVDVGPRSREADCDIRSEEVAVYHPEGSLAVRTDDRGRAIEAMAEAFSRFLARQPDVAGVMGLGLDFAQAFPFADGGKLLDLTAYFAKQPRDQGVLETSFLQVRPWFKVNGHGSGNRNYSPLL